MQLVVEIISNNASRAQSFVTLFVTLTINKEEKELSWRTMTVTVGTQKRISLDRRL